MKAATLAKLQQAALDGACQLFYFDGPGLVLRLRCSAAGRPSANRIVSSHNRIADAPSSVHWISVPTC